MKMCSDAYTITFFSDYHNKEKTSHKEMCSDAHTSSCSDVHIRLWTPHIKMCSLSLLLVEQLGWVPQKIEK